MQDRRAARPDFELDRARVGEFLRQRNLIPAEVRHAHIDGVKTIVGARRQAIIPAGVANFSSARPVSSLTSAATQRMPLPQAPASEPSLL